MAGTAHDNIGLDRVEFQINGGPFQPATGTAEWRADITLTPGKNAVGVRSVDLAENTSLEKFRYFSYVVDAPLVVRINGSGSVVPPLNGRLLEIGKFYQITARPAFGQLFIGWLGARNGTAPRLVFQMESNLVLTANFVPNPFLTVAGTYVGLLMDTNAVFPANSSFVTFQVGQSGLYSGKIMMNGANYPFHGRFSVLGASMSAVLRPGLVPIAFMLQLDLNGTSNQLSGMGTDGTWTAPLSANRVVLGTGYGPGPQSQHRALVLQRTPEDGGAIVGTGTAIISPGGSVSIRGVLSDGRKFNLATALSQNGDSPFYLSSGHGAEIIVGWLNLPPQPPTSVAGDLIWSKPEANGFSAGLIVVP